MKKIVFLAASMFYSVFSFAQNLHTDQVPSVVRNVFKQKFPGAFDIEWEMKNKLYEVEFEIGHTDHEAWIDDNGKIVRHKFDISSAELPKQVTTSVNQSYKGFRIDDAEKIETQEKVLYKLELKSHNAEQDVVFDGAGNEIGSY